MNQKSDDDLLRDLDSADEYVRAQAAVTLVARHHPRALEASLRTLDDAPEIAHADVTPAVWSLAGLGLPALQALLGPMDDPNPMTRLHAGRAAMEITKRQFGYDGRDWPEGGYTRWADWWLGIDSRYDAPPDARNAAIGRLRAACEAWLAGARP
jgi:hypothetical protein